MTDNNNPQKDDDSEENFSFDSEEDDFSENDAIPAPPDESGSEDNNYSFDDEDDFFLPNSKTDENINQSDNYKIGEDKQTNYSRRKKLTRRKKRTDFFEHTKKPLIIAGAFIFLAAISIFAYAYFSITPDRIMNNIFIENLDVSSLTYQEAVDAINSAYLLENTEITLISGENSYPIYGSDIGLTAAPEETAEKALNYCRSNNFFINGLKASMLLFKKHVIVPAPQLDTDKLDEKINEFGNITLGEKKQHYVEFGDDGLATVYSGQTGYNGDPSAVREQILNSLNHERFSGINVTYTSAPPDNMTLETFDALVYKDPENAGYEVNGNEINIIPGVTGRYINKEEAAPLLQNVYEGCEPVKIPYYVSVPDTTEDTLRGKLLSGTLASYSTSYSGSTSNRRANVARAASLINGTVVAPGDVFSFNDTVGHRTAENGFLTAKEYIDGKSVDGIGGGTCQVSSTLYSAVLYADMEIVERLNHMMTVGYIPLGQDATVSDGGVDFKFRNSSDHPIKISASANGTSIAVAIIGTPWEPAREVKISNSTSQSGVNTVVRSTRQVYSNGALISTDTLNSSTYMPHPTAKPSE